MRNESSEFILSGPVVWGAVAMGRVVREYAQRSVRFFLSQKGSTYVYKVFSAKKRGTCFSRPTSSIFRIL